MAKRKKQEEYERSASSSLLHVVIGIVILVVIVAIGFNSDSNFINDLLENIEVNALERVENVDNSIDKEENPENITKIDGNLVIDYIDVGQGDSILIRQGEHAMLIDGGTSECKDDLLEFLNSQNISKFDYIIGTHPHEDHIGSLDDVVNAYDFDTILFPKTNPTPTTKTFENLVTAVAAKGTKFTTPLAGKEYNLGEAKFQILAPSYDSYTSTNDYSIVVRMTYGTNTFMFTGDAESLSESEILNSFDDIHADVLKVGHHGSTTSTSKKFLDAVSPKYAVISVGKDNSYNHPTKTTMDKLYYKEIPVYRTDEQGTIECISDGVNITFNVEPGSYNYMKD